MMSVRRPPSPCIATVSATRRVLVCVFVCMLWEGGVMKASRVFSELDDEQQTQVGSWRLDSLLKRL